MSSILDHWPFPKMPPRPSQEVALEWMAEKAPDYRYLILEMPVGGGKSWNAITLSRYLGGKKGNSYLLTPQRILQEQYARDFPIESNMGVFSFKGKSNYTCKSKNTTCDIGGLISKPACEKCSYQTSKRQAMQAPNAILNYKLALSLFTYTDAFQPRSLVVLDEGHTLENHLIDFDALAITAAKCKLLNIKWFKHKDIFKAHDWLKNEYRKKLKKILDDQEEEMDDIASIPSRKLTKANLKKLKEYNRSCDHLDEVSIMSIRTGEYMNDNFVLVQDANTIQFKRLKGDYSFKNILEPVAKDNFLIMSSTILNKDGYCEDLGIDPEQTAFLSLDSEFPVKNRPVYYMPYMKMNVNWNKPERSKEREVMLGAVDKLLNIHKEETGIIHTTNFKISEWLVDSVDDTHHNIYHHNPGSGDKRDSVINAFLNDPKPSVLISPSITEGLDLKGDLGRFAIVAKTPFANLGDQWVKRRMELSPEWYNRQTWISIIQGGGRIVRSDTDTGVVYILDGSFGYFMNRTSNMVPRWWKKGYDTI